MLHYPDCTPLAAQRVHAECGWLQCVLSAQCVQEAYESRQPLLPDTQLPEGVAAPAATKGKAGAMLQAVAAIAFDKDGKRVLLGDDHGVVSVINFDIAADGSSVELTLEATVRLYGVLRH